MRNSSISIRPILGLLILAETFCILLANTEQFHKKINSFHYLMEHFATNSLKQAHWNAAQHKIKYSISSTSLGTDYLWGQFSKVSCPDPLSKLETGTKVNLIRMLVIEPCTRWYHWSAKIPSDPSECPFPSYCVLLLPLSSPHLCSWQTTSWYWSGFPLHGQTARSTWEFSSQLPALPQGVTANQSEYWV